MSQRRERSGFSLAELMLVIAIIGVLASMAVGVLRNAQEESRGSATKALASQIDNLLKQRMEHYAVRKVPLRLRAYVDDTLLASSNTTMREVIVGLRDAILLDIIRTEMPVATDADYAFPSTELETHLNTVEAANAWDSGLIDQTTLIADLQAQEPAAVNRILNLPAGSPVDTANTQFANQELLFEVLATTDFNDGPGTSLLNSGAIGDTDEDGLPEILDSWGDPLGFEISYGGAATPDYANPVKIRDVRINIFSVNLQ